MEKLYTLLLFSLAFTANAQTIISQWNFDDAVPATAMLPTTGSGTFTLIGGVLDNLTNGVMPGGNPSSGKGYSIRAFPPSQTASGTAGFQFALSTENYSGITVTFDPRGTPTSSKWQQYEYTTDGTNWNIIGNNTGALLNAFLDSPMITLTLPANADNKTNFVFRIVSIFDPTGNDYATVGGTASTYSTNSNWRIDNATFSGTVLSLKQNTITGLNVYPNPVTNGNLFITSDSNETKSVAIFDVLGKRVLKTIATDQSINVSNLNKGVYILKITEDRKTSTRKLVIQ